MYINSVRYKPSKSSNTVHGHTAAGLVSELHLQQVQPVINHLVWRSRAIIKGPVLGEHNFAHTLHVLTEQTGCSVFEGWSKKEQFCSFLCEFIATDWNVLNLLPERWFEITLILTEAISHLRSHVSAQHNSTQLSRPHQDLYAFLLHWRLVIRSSAHPNQSVYSIGLEILHTKTRRSNCFINLKWRRSKTCGNHLSVLYLYKLSQLCICGIMCDEESQTVVSNLHWRWSVHFHTQKDLLVH